MDYPGLSFCFLIILNFLVSFTTSQPNFTYKSCSTSGNYTTNSTYSANLKTLLSSISNSSDLNSDGFFNASIGQSPDQVYAIGLCRGDQTVTSCRSCLNDSSQAITQACPNQKVAIGGYDNCMLRFSNSSILSSEDDDFVYLGCNVNNATNLAQFNNLLGNLLFSLRDRAAAAATRKYAADEANYTSFSKIYGLEQCTPDISEAGCGRCLDMARFDMTNYCGGKVGATSVRYSCVLRFEIYQFYQPTAGAPPPRGTESPPPSSTTTPGGGSNKSRTIIVVVVPTASVVLIVFLICLFLRLRKRKQYMSMHATVHEPVDEISSVESLYFDFGTIRIATDDFSDANKLGQGGFGAVYKGRLQNGREIAVKRLSKDSGQGELKFKNEVLLVAKLQHRNLVRFLGFCLEKTERLLIYEFVPNASL